MGNVKWQAVELSLSFRCKELLGLSEEEVTRLQLHGGSAEKGLEREVRQTPERVIQGALMTARPGVAERTSTESSPGTGLT